MFILGISLMEGKQLARFTDLLGKQGPEPGGGAPGTVLLTGGLAALPGPATPYCLRSASSLLAILLRAC